jgi:hypothetical protein
MSARAPGCNSLKPKKLPVETRQARSSTGWYEPPISGVEILPYTRRSNSIGNAVSRPCNSAADRDVNAGKESW